MVRLLREKVWNGPRKFMKIASISRDKGLGATSLVPISLPFKYPCILVSILLALRAFVSYGASFDCSHRHYWMINGISSNIMD